MQQDMVILSRSFDLLTWLLPKIEQFPRIYRYSVTRRMMDAALDFQELLFDAQNQRGSQRLSTLYKIDARLNRLRLYLRLAHLWRWLDDGLYEYISHRIAELGRLLGGCNKQTRSGIR